MSSSTVARYKLLHLYIPPTFFVNNMEHCNKRMMFSLSIIDSKIGEVSIRDWALILYVLHQPQSLHLLPMSTFRNIY